MSKVILESKIVNSGYRKTENGCQKPCKMDIFGSGTVYKGGDSMYDAVLELNVAAYVASKARNTG